MTNNSTLIEAVIGKKIKTAEGFSVVLSKAAKQILRLLNLQSLILGNKNELLFFFIMRISNNL